MAVWKRCGGCKDAVRSAEMSNRRAAFVVRRRVGSTHIFFDDSDVFLTLHELAIKRRLFCKSSPAVDYLLLIRLRYRNLCGRLIFGHFESCSIETGDIQ